MHGHTLYLLGLLDAGRSGNPITLGILVVIGLLKAAEGAEAAFAVGVARQTPDSLDLLFHLLS